MRIVLIQHTGAGAAYRLFRSLKKGEINVTFFVGRKIYADKDIICFAKNNLRLFLFKSKEFIGNLACRIYKIRNKMPFSTALMGLDVNNYIFMKNADIINLHWVVGGMMSIKTISQLQKLNKPIVWTLHDMWPITGGCHHSFACKGYEEKCGRCPVLNSNSTNDLSRFILTNKIKYFKNLNLTIVTPSNWLKNCVEKSNLFKKLQIYVIPNPIDINIFKPLDKSYARKIFNIDEDKKVILFGAVNVDSPFKGYKYVLEALKHIADERYYIEKLEFVVFGEINDTVDFDDLPYKFNYVGFLNDYYTMALLYNCADVFIMTSVAENLPTTVMESLSCGTPVVAFNTGGVPDLIDHKKNGYLTSGISSKYLSDGIKWVLDDQDRYKKLQENARNKVLENYREEIVAKKYIDLYKQLLINQNRG